MGNKLWLGLLITAYASSLSAGIYIGTDATPPATYQSNANYPANVIASNNTAGQRNCRLYYDGKGPIPPLTCSPTVAPPMAAPATTVNAPTPVAPIKNDQAAQLQPLAHVDTTTPAPLTRPATTAPVTPIKLPSNSGNTSLAAKSASSSGCTSASNAGCTSMGTKSATSTPVVKPVAPPPPPKPKFVATAVPGSLKDNVERIVAQSHWGTVVWNLPVDYNWNGTMTITADDVQSAIAQLLAHYPVQATFYDKNHIVSVEARRVI